MKLSLIPLISAGLISISAQSALAGASDPSGDCECPSIEEQVQERFSEYKKKLDEEIKSLKDQVSKERIDELQKNLQRLFDDMLKEFDKDESAKPKETQI
jgi:uncharacterized membrane protein